MEITVTQRRENALLDRTEVLFDVAHPGEGTPARADIRKALAAVLNAKDGIVILDWARSEFGKTATRGYAKVYKSKQRAMTLETAPILIRNGLLQAKAKKEAPPKEAPPPKGERPAKPEAPAEAPKEAPKPEAPKKEKAPSKDEAAKAAKEEKKEAPAKKEPAKGEAPKEKKPAAKKEGK